MDDTVVVKLTIRKGACMKKHFRLLLILISIVSLLNYIKNGSILSIVVIVLAAIEYFINEKYDYKREK